ncbi:STAS/SEC14 domain-containing protein [Lysobacter sp. A3-1-A15]|uniref:STAS/SEC14 domain-containing protein n=1 Tax=Novilysobacter viscosus TaxID=3098602 RepID=UPI002ED91E9C
MVTELPAPPHVVAFRVEGKLTEDGYDAVVAALEARLASQERIAVFFDMRGMSGMTPAAFGKDVAYSVRKLRELHRFARGAVVTDSDWLTGLVRFGSAFFPRIDLRVFPGAEHAPALDWASTPLPDAGG